MVFCGSLFVPKGQDFDNLRLQPGVVAARNTPCPPRRGGTDMALVSPFQGEVFWGGRYPRLKSGVIEISSLQDDLLPYGYSMKYDFWLRPCRDRSFVLES